MEPEQPAPVPAKQAVVIGATSMVAPQLCTRLAAAGYAGHCTSRGAGGAALPAGFRWQPLDPAAPGDWSSPAGAFVFSLVPLPALVPLLPRLEGAKQIVALSTAGLFYKTDSPDPAERARIAAIQDGEQALQRFCEARGIAWTLLRPTLIYRPWEDLTVSAIARFIERFGCFLVASPARGLRQPVHADDVAQAAAAAAENPRAANRAFTLTGGETLSYRDMVRRVFQALGRRPVILALPAWLLGLGLRLARGLVGRTYSPALFARMNSDAAFDSSAAAEALGFTPREFRPEFPNRPR